MLAPSYNLGGRRTRCCTKPKLASYLSCIFSFVIPPLIATLPTVPCLQVRDMVRKTLPSRLIEVYVGDSPLQWQTWSRQPGVSLIGDAAHAMLPSLGKLCAEQLTHVVQVQEMFVLRLLAVYFVCLSNPTTVVVQS